MEQIYTIPVNEAFDMGRDTPTSGCPFCRLYVKLEEDELDIILGASMMEPDIRVKTNEQGFCDNHFRMMLGRKRKLGMGLLLESHLAEVRRRIGKNPKDLVLGPGKAQLAELSAIESSCYVCTRIDKNLSAMIATAVYLWESDLEFQKKFARQPYFCLPHYRSMLEYASKKMNKKVYREFYSEAYRIMDGYLESLTNDVSWLCKKFDYRYDEEPWYNAKDSVERSIWFLTGAKAEDRTDK